MKASSHSNVMSVRKALLLEALEIATKRLYMILRKESVPISSDASGSKMSGSGTGRVLEVGTRDGSGTNDSYGYPGTCRVVRLR